jgi:hypothetical protein
MVLATSFPSAEAMYQQLAMSMQEGLTAAGGQTADVLAGTPQRASGPFRGMALTRAFCPAALDGVDCYSRA